MKQGVEIAQFTDKVNCASFGLQRKSAFLVTFVARDKSNAPTASGNEIKNKASNPTS